MSETQSGYMKARWADPVYRAKNEERLRKMAPQAVAIRDKRKHLPTKGTPEGILYRKVRNRHGKAAALAVMEALAIAREAVSLG